MTRLGVQGKIPPRIRATTARCKPVALQRPPNIPALPYVMSPLLLAVRVAYASTIPLSLSPQLPVDVARLSLPVSLTPASRASYVPWPLLSRGAPSRVTANCGLLVLVVVRVSAPRTVSHRGLLPIAMTSKFSPQGDPTSLVPILVR